MAMVEPAGMTTRPSASVRSLVTRALTTSPTLFFREVIESLMVAVIGVPAARLGGAAGAARGADAGAGASATVGRAGRAFDLGLGLGAAGAGSGAGAGAALSAGTSFNGFDESTGAS